MLVRPTYSYVRKVIPFWSIQIDWIDGRAASPTAGKNKQLGVLLNHKKENKTSQIAL